MTAAHPSLARRLTAACLIVPALSVFSAAEPKTKKPSPRPPEIACKNLDSAAQKMSDDAVAYLESHGHQSLVVGPLQGPPRGLGGALIAQAIRAHLPKQIDNRPGPAAVALVGRYKLRQVKGQGPNDPIKSSVVIEVSLTDAVGEPLVDLPACVLSDAASMKTLMATRAGGAKSK